MRAVLFLSIAFGCISALGAESVSYLRDIKPLFKEKCGVCHGAMKQEAGLRLDAGQLIHQGSDEGPIIKIGQATASRLIKKVTHEDPAERMPPEGEGAPLDARQVAMLTTWINAGAPIPSDEAIPADPRLHWAYQLPLRPDVPRVDDAGWSQPIDAFIAREHRRQGLTAVDLADRYTLLRRVYMDLIGLPPTRKQIGDFIQDESEQAWTNVIDSLLDNPQYGERWGRHWMDVWRYSDWDGYKQELRSSQRHIWRWRDWIVQSLNADKGYDQMVVEMLAGDEVAPTDESVLPATGFLARNFHKSNRNIWLDATVEHTAKAFLGTTLNCARCHDHKFDPIAQTAYYEFRAIFEPHNIRTDRVPGQSDVMKDGIPRAFDADLSAETFLYIRGNEKHPDKDHPIQPSVPSVLGGQFEINPVDLPPEARHPELRDFVIQELRAAVGKQLEEAKDDTQRTIAKLRIESLLARQAADLARLTEADETKTKELAVAAASLERKLNVQVAEAAVAQAKSAIESTQTSEEPDERKKQAAIDKAKQDFAIAESNLKVARDASMTTDGGYTPLGKEYPRTSSGRRTALARWIAAKENPLTARVAVNHIWMRHFGAPLVENVFDFGLRSPKPRHADLLDWLAVELMENNWSMKHLHRLIVDSRTYQFKSTSHATNDATNNPQSAFPNPQSTDPDNHYLWRSNVRRLDAEIVRDNLLAVSGQLDAAQGGPDIDYAEGEKSRRRSIYLRHAYEKQMTMLVLFDGASPNECYRRSESVIPQQALALTNSPIAIGSSRLLAKQLWQEVAAAENEKESVFVQNAFLQILSRPPDEAELHACVAFLDEQTKTLSETSDLTTFASGGATTVKRSTDPRQRAVENLVHVLMNHNDFVTVR